MCYGPKCRNRHTLCRCHFLDIQLGYAFTVCLSWVSNQNKCSPTSWCCITFKVSKFRDVLFPFVRWNPYLLPRYGIKAEPEALKKRP